MFVHLRAAAAASALMLGALAAPVPSFADAMSSTTVDCASADKMMSGDHMAMSGDHAMSGGAMSGDHAMAMTGNIDKDFMSAAMSHNQAMIAMAKAEVACGKDAKMKAAAQKLLDNSQRALDIIKEVQGTG